MHIEHCAAAQVPQRRQLMHPGAVVMLVVSVVVGVHPAAQHQGGFDVHEALTRHQNIHVRNHAPDRRLQARQCVRTPLEQHHRQADGLQGARNLSHLKMQFALLTRHQRQR